MENGIVNLNMQRWLQVGGALFVTLRPKGAGLELFGHGMDPDAFAALVEREMDATDDFLVALSDLPGHTEVLTSVRALPPDALIAFWSRFGHHYEGWLALRRQPDPGHWVPPRHEDIWRAIFLSMVQNRPRAIAVARRRWPEAFEAALW